jgi:protein-disulfide isomerase/rhodanese-related sulfurtransferase
MRKLILLSLSLLGLFDSAFLWWMYASPTRPMVCTGNGCDVVRASSYAHLWSIPTPAYGAAMYCALALLIFVGPLSGGSWARRLTYGVAAISGAGFLVSLFLSGIEAFVLHHWCEWCVASAIAVTIMFALALMEVLRPQPPPEGAAALASLRKYVTVVMLAILVGVPAFILLSRVETGGPPTQASDKALREYLVRPDSHVLGDPNSPVTVVEFSDFQCPFCGQAEKTVVRIRAAYKNRVRFVFRQFPLPTIHAFAEKAAEASECAAEQGKFWEAFEKLYANQEDLTTPALEQYASDLGLDRGRFDQCLSSGAMAARVAQDKSDGQALGVDRTPTFFIDGRKYIGAPDYSRFAQILDNALASRGVPPPQPEPEERPQVAVKKSNPKPASQSSSSAAESSVPASSSSSGLLGGGSGASFFSGGSSLEGCSADEAYQQQQPDQIDTAQARQIFQQGAKALFVDVRSPADFRKARIRGAINVPLSDLEKRWSQLPKDRNLVLYESGGSAGSDDICAFGRAAGRFLLAHGFSPDRVKVYHDGLKGWEKAGLPVESGRSSGS